MEEVDAVLPREGGQPNNVVGLIGTVISFFETEVVSTVTAIKSEADNGAYQRALIVLYRKGQPGCVGSAARTTTVLSISAAALMSMRLGFKFILFVFQSVMETAYCAVVATVLLREANL